MNRVDSVIINMVGDVDLRCDVMLVVVVAVLLIVVTVVHLEKHVSALVVESISSKRKLTE